MAKKLSRALNLDIEKCVTQAGVGRFEIILIAAARARELSRQHRNSGNMTIDHVHTGMSSLLEVQEGKIGVEYLRKIK